jgi:hypothetical protein
MKASHTAARHYVVISGGARREYLAERAGRDAEGRPWAYYAWVQQLHRASMFSEERAVFLAFENGGQSVPA